MSPFCLCLLYHIIMTTILLERAELPLIFTFFFSTNINSFSLCKGLFVFNRQLVLKLSLLF